MNVGFIYTKASYGQIIRVEAIKQYMIKNNVNVVDIEFELGVESKIKRIINYIFKSDLLKNYDKSLNFIDNVKINEIFLTNRNLFSKFIDTLDLKKFEKLSFFHAENHTGAFLALILKEKLGIPYVFDMHGLAYEEAVGNKSSFIDCIYIKKLEEITVKNASYINVVSNFMKDYLHEKYNYPTNNVLIIPCGSKVYHKYAKYNEKFNIIYAGGLGYWESVMDYVNMPLYYSKKYTNDNNFYFLGGGKNMQDILNYIKDKNIDLKYIGSKSRDETLDILCDMQIGVVPSTKDTARVCASPVKVVDYASCGLPIISANVGEWTDIIKAYDAGIICNESDPEEFAYALNILKDKNVWIEKSKNAIKMVNERYDWDVILQPLLELYGS